MKLFYTKEYDIHSPYTPKEIHAKLRKCVKSSENFDLSEFDIKYYGKFDINGFELQKDSLLFNGWSYKGRLYRGLNYSKIIGKISESKNGSDIHISLELSKKAKISIVSELLFSILMLIPTIMIVISVYKNTETLYGLIFLLFPILAFLFTLTGPVQIHFWDKRLIKEITEVLT